MEKPEETKRSSSADTFTHLSKKLKSNDKKLNAQIKKTHFVQQQTEKYSKITNLLNHEDKG